MRSSAGVRPWLPPRSASIGFRFPPEVIVVAVRWYLRFGLSYRDVEELLLEDSIEVDHVTVYRWVQRFTPLLLDAVRFCRHSPGDPWFVDETYVKVNGVWRYVYRAIDPVRTGHRHTRVGPVGAENSVRPGQAACPYSWRSPPR